MCFEDPGIAMKNESGHDGGSNCSLKLSSAIFRFLCSFHGLEAGFPCIRIFGLVFWVIGAATFPFTQSLYVLHATVLTTENKALSDLLVLFGGLNFMLTTFASMFTFIINHRVVENLIQTDLRNSRDVVMPILICIPFILTCVSILCRADDVMTRVAFANYLCFEISSMIFFMIYFNATGHIVVQLGKLRETVQRRRSSSSFVMRQKLRIREDIRVINSTFARSLALPHLQFFIGTTSTFVLDPYFSMFEKALLIGTFLSGTMMIIRVAQIGSQIISQCLDTEFHLWSLRMNPENTQNRLEQSEMMEFLRFREEWDTLRVAWFTLNLGGLLQYVLSIITCVAVVLQFDYKVVRSITALASQSP